MLNVLSNSFLMFSIKVYNQAAFPRTHHAVSRKFHQPQHGREPRHEGDLLGHGDKNPDSIAIKIRKVSQGMMPTIRDEEVENQG